jgi:hypothetical protein
MILLRYLLPPLYIRRRSNSNRAALLLFDAASILACVFLLSSPASCIAQNLLKNGSMTDGGAVPADWAALGHPGTESQDLEIKRDTSTYRSKPASLYFEITYGDRTGDIVTSFPVGPKTPYELTFASKLDGNIQTARVFVDWIKGSEALKSQELGKMPTSTDWKVTRFRFTAPGMVHEARLRFSVQGGKLWGWLDDVVVKKAPSTK